MVPISFTFELTMLPKNLKFCLPIIFVSIFYLEGAGVGQLNIKTFLQNSDSCCFRQDVCPYYQVKCQTQWCLHSVLCVPVKTRALCILPGPELLCPKCQLSDLFIFHLFVHFLPPYTRSFKGSVLQELRWFKAQNRYHYKNKSSFKNVPAGLFLNSNLHKNQKSNIGNALWHYILVN
jgi:hypothetical protein